jgi:hypothetical protein
MTKGLIVGLGVVSIIVLMVVFVVSTFIGAFNSATDFTVTIEAKIKDNKNEFDNMKKKICQVAQVSTEQMNALADIFNGYAKARSGNGDDGKLIMKWISESIPNVDTSTFKNLQNIIVSSRDAWTMRQKELIDLQREYNRLLKRFPSNFMLRVMGFKEVEIPVIISTVTEETFKTGKDDDTAVFGDKTKAEKKQ